MQSVWAADDGRLNPSNYTFHWQNNNNLKFESWELIQSRTNRFSYTITQTRLLIGAAPATPVFCEVKMFFFLNGVWWLWRQQHNITWCSLAGNLWDPEAVDHTSVQVRITTFMHNTAQDRSGMAFNSSIQQSQNDSVSLWSRSLYLPSTAGPGSLRPSHR